MREMLSAMANQLVLQSARNLFPKSAGNISVTYAWRRRDSTLDHPLEVGPDGWTRVDKLATRALLEQLQGQGFTHVALHPQRARGDRSPVTIVSLL